MAAQMVHWIQPLLNPQDTIEIFFVAVADGEGTIRTPAGRSITGPHALKSRKGIKTHDFSVAVKRLVNTPKGGH